MVSNIESICLWEHNPKSYNNIPLVRINFKFPCAYTTLNIRDLEQILRLWIKGEERVYPLEMGFQGRWLLFAKIEQWFKEVE